MLWSQRPRDWTSRLSTRPIHTRAAAPQHNTNTITQGSSINGSADGLSRVVYAAGSCDVRSRVRPLLLPPPAPPAPPPPLSSLRVRPTRLNCCRHLPCTYTQTHAPKHPPPHTQTQTAFAFPFPSIFGVGGGGGLFDANKCSKVDAAELRRRVGTPQLLWSCGLVVDGATECLGAGLLFVLLCCFRRAHALALPLFI